MLVDERRVGGRDLVQASHAAIVSSSNCRSCAPATPSSQAFCKMRPAFGVQPMAAEYASGGVSRGVASVPVPGIGEAASARLP